MTEIAAPTWGHRRGRRAEEPVAAARLRALPPRRRPLELRVHAPRLGAALAGAALAAGFALLWAFLLLGVVGPAAGLR